MKRLFYIKNEQAGDMTQSVLSLQIGERHFGFAITDETGSILHLLGYYTAEEMDAGTLSSVYSDNYELGRPFYSVQVSYDHGKNVLVPVQHFNADSSRSLPDCMFGKDGRSFVLYEAVNEWQLYNVYAVPADVQEWVNRKFPSAVHRHYFTLGIKSMAAGPGDRILADIHTDEFSFIAIKGNKLLIAQTHPYSSPEDICYYLLKTCHQFSLSQEQVQLTVSGLIEKESQLYRELYQFFVHVEFREPAWTMPVMEDHEYPAHFFTSLNDLARCAS
ncbi:MAG: DUF3822 family protein [Chitinophagaceae bacterium]|nr:DUF3822 family protein [Chitinophagaceae bacterium]